MIVLMPSAAIFKRVLDILYYSGASFALRRHFGGVGAIFMLHHVLPGAGNGQGFSPNAGLEVAPEFLDQVILMLKIEGFDLINLDDAAKRVRSGGRPFAVFTLDDGYRDNLLYAQPVFRRHNCPYTVYVAPAIADGTCELWWRGLESVISRNGEILAEIDGESWHMNCESESLKWAAWKRLYWPVRLMEQHEQRRWIRKFTDRHGVNLGEICRNAAMTWAEVRELADDPLCTIGAHTVHHYNIKALSEDEAASEMLGSADRIEAELGKRPVHFAYPYGDETSAGPRDFDLAVKAGFETAVTTRKGLIFPEHNDHLTALPRFSLSGDYQNPRYFKTLLSGLPFVLLNRLRTVNVN